MYVCFVLSQKLKGIGASSSLKDSYAVTFTILSISILNGVNSFTLSDRDFNFFQTLVRGLICFHNTPTYTWNYCADILSIVLKVKQTSFTTIVPNLRHVYRNHPPLLVKRQVLLHLQPLNKPCACLKMKKAITLHTSLSLGIFVLSQGNYSSNFLNA